MDTWSEEYRIECFAREMLNNWTIYQRREYLDEQDRKGNDTSAIRAALLAEVEKRRPATPESPLEANKAANRASIESMRRLAANAETGR